MHPVLFMTDDEKRLRRITSILNDNYNNLFINTYMSNFRAVSEFNKPLFYYELMSDAKSLNRALTNRNVTDELFYIVDLCLTKEEKDQIAHKDLSNLKLHTLSGYRVAMHINRKTRLHNVILLSDYPLEVLGMNESDNEFTPVITVPDKKASNDIIQEFVYKVLSKYYKYVSMMDRVIK